MLTKKGNPITEHHLANRVFVDQNKTNNETKWYKNQIKKEYKDKQEEDIRIQKGFYDFREKALNENDGGNYNKRKLDELLKPIDFKEYCKHHQFTAGLEEKIAKNIGSFKKQNGRWPTKVLSIVTFTMEDDYLISKEDKQFWLDTASISPPETTVTIVLVNPTGDEYTII